MVLFVATGSAVSADIEHAVDPGWVYGGTGVMGYSHLLQIPEYGWVQFKAQFACSDSNEVYVSPNSFTFEEGDGFVVHESDVSGDYIDVTVFLDNRASWQRRASTFGGSSGFIFSFPGLAYRLLHSPKITVQVYLRNSSASIRTYVHFPLYSSFNVAWGRCPR